MNGKPVYSLLQLILYTLKLGATGFGGPVALVGYMFRDLVEKRRWISEGDYKDGLALAQLAPGPLAAQTAMYMGYVHYRVTGATLVGLAFVLPSFLMVVILGWLYKIYGELNWISAVFYGVGACVIGIIAHSAFNLTRKTIGKDWLLWVIYLITGIFTVLTESENVFIFIGAGILVWLVKNPPKWFSKPKNLNGILFISLLASGTPLLSADFLPALGKIFLFFAKAGTFVFGSGLAIVPFLYGGVVQQYHWLNDRQFLDAVAVAMITPGPVVITVGFIGYLVAGLWGAVVAALGTFLPCYLFTVIPAPYFKKYGKRPAIQSFVDGVTSAAIGAISGAVIVLGRRAITDIPTALLAAAAIVALFVLRKFPEPVLVAIAAFFGLVFKLGIML